MKLACADYTFPLLPHDDVLSLISTLKFDGVDIGLFEDRSHLWPSREFKKIKENAAELRRKIEARGLVASDVFLQMHSDIVPYAINRPEPARREKARDWFLRTLEYANEVGSHHVTALPGVPIDDESRATWLERSYEELRWRVEESRKAGLIFGVEAHIGSIAPTPKDALEMVEAVPGLTLALDYSHFTRAGISDEQAERLVPYASVFQIRGACDGRLQCNFAQNTIDYERALRRLKEQVYSAWISVEYVRTDWERCNESDNLSETILFRDFLRERARTLCL